MRSPAPSTFRVFIVGIAASVAVAMASAYGNDGADLQALLESAFDAYAPTALASTGDLSYDPHDGRSAVISWRASLAAFAASDREHPPAPGGVVFVGSSSIRLWPNLEGEFPAQRIVKRGFGGSRMSDCARYADRLVLPYQPRRVVVYAGDNDLAAGATPQEVLAQYVELVRQVHAALPAARIAFISVKPSPLRAALLPQVRLTNQLVADYSRSDPQLDYIDVYTKMLDGTGQPRADLFLPDALHPNAAGYAIWKTALERHLR